MLKFERKKKSIAKRLNKTAFRPRNVYDEFFQFPEYMLFIPLNTINRVTFIMETRCVFWDVRIDSKNVSSNKESTQCTSCITGLPKIVKNSCFIRYNVSPKERRFGVPTPVGARRFSFLHTRPGGPWDPPSFLYNGYHCSFSWGRVARTWR